MGSSSTKQQEPPSGGGVAAVRKAAPPPSRLPESATIVTSASPRPGLHRSAPFDRADATAAAPSSSSSGRTPPPSGSVKAPPHTSSLVIPSLSRLDHAAQNEAAQSAAEDTKRKQLQQLMRFEMVPSASAVTDTATARARPVDWRQLGPSPIDGFVLTEEGFMNKDTKFVASADEIRKLINDMGKIEGRSQKYADDRLGMTFGLRVMDGFDRLGGSALLGMSLFFGAYKLPQSYQYEMPQNSLLIRYYYVWRHSAVYVERLCQRRRMLFCLTTPRSLFFMACTAFCVSSAVSSYGSMTTPSDSKFDRTTKESIRYYQHTEGALKYLMTVYYHHPAYVKESSDPEYSTMAAMAAQSRAARPQDKTIADLDDAVAGAVPVRGVYVDRRLKKPGSSTAAAAAAAAGGTDERSTPHV